MEEDVGRGNREGRRLEEPGGAIRLEGKRGGQTLPFMTQHVKSPDSGNLSSNFLR